MKFIVNYEFNDKAANIYEVNTLEIPIKSYMTICDDTYYSIQRYILGYEGLHHGFFALGEVKIKSVKIEV